MLIVNVYCVHLNVQSAIHTGYTYITRTLTMSGRVLQQLTYIKWRMFCIILWSYFSLFSTSKKMVICFNLEKLLMALTIDLYKVWKVWVKDYSSYRCLKGFNKRLFKLSMHKETVDGQTHRLTERQVDNVITIGHLHWKCEALSTWIWASLHYASKIINFIFSQKKKNTKRIITVQLIISQIHTLAKR